MKKLFSRIYFQIFIAYLINIIIFLSVAFGHGVFQGYRSPYFSWSDVLALLEAPFSSIFLLIVPFLVGIGEIVRWINEGRFVAISDKEYLYVLVPLICLWFFYLTYKKIKRPIARIILSGILFSAWLWCGFFLAASLD